MTGSNFSVAFLLFPDVTQLDLTGPYEILARMPGARVELVWKTRDPVRSDHGMCLLPTATFDEVDSAHLLCVPGGPGVAALMEDEETLIFLRRIARSARFVTSVCTGSLVLGAAGLLQGRRATCHWLSRDLLAHFGALPVNERVVTDGNLITGGGVTAGIDFALCVVAQLHGPDAARRIQLGVEYDPSPPFDCGSPELAGEAITDQLRSAAAARHQQRAELVGRAAQRLGL